MNHPFVWNEQLQKPNPGLDGDLLPHQIVWTFINWGIRRNQNQWIKEGNTRFSSCTNYSEFDFSRKYYQPLQASVHIVGL